MQAATLMDYMGISVYFAYAIVLITILFAIFVKNKVWRIVVVGIYYFILAPIFVYSSYYYGKDISKLGKNIVAYQKAKKMNYEIRADLEDNMRIINENAVDGVVNPNILLNDLGSNLSIGEHLTASIFINDCFADNQIPVSRKLIGEFPANREIIITEIEQAVKDGLYYKNVEKCSSLFKFIANY